MGARSAPELALWRTAPYSVSYYAYIHAPTTVFAARINQTSFEYPLMQLTFDTVTTGAFTDIAAEMLVLVGTSAGADDLGRQRVRAAADGTVSTSTTVNIGRSSKGTRDGELSPADNAYLTVLDLRVIFATPPFINTDDPDNPFTLKDGAIPFDTTAAFPPIASVNTGDVFEIVATSGDDATLSFPCTATATHPDASATLDYTLTIPDATPTSRTGTATSETPFTPASFVIPVGTRYGVLEVADSLGNISRQHVLIVVEYEGSPSLLTEFEIVRWVERADGTDMQLRVSEPIPYSAYPDGTEVLVRQRERFGTTVGSVVEDDEVVFAGFISSESNEGAASRAGFIGRTTLTLVDAAGRLKQLPGFPMVVERKTEPTEWEHMEGANIDLYVTHILRWHSNVLARVSFTWSGVGDDYPFPTLGSDGTSLWDQAHVRCQAIAYALTCDPRGRLAMRGDPQLLPTTAQAATFGLPTSRTPTSTLTVTTGDWKNYRFQYTRHPRIHWNWGESILASTADADDGDIGTVFCVAPGAAPGQGVSAQTSGQQLAVSQHELNVREGHRYAARMNARNGYVETSTRGGSVGVHPANMEWVVFDVDAATAAPRGRVFSEQKFLPIEVTYSVNHRNGTRETRLTLEAEVQGSEAETYVPPEGIDGVYLPPTPPPLPPVLTPPIIPVTHIPEWTGALPIKAWAISYTESKIARATSYDPVTGFNWEDASTGWAGTGIWGRSDPYNYYRKFGLGTDGLYRRNDLWASGSWTQVATNAQMFGNSARRGYKLLMSHMRQGWIMALSGESGAAVSFDYGLSWIQVGIDGSAGAWGTATNRGGDVEICGHDVDHLYSIVKNTSGLPWNYHVYRSVDGGLTWSLVGANAMNNGGGLSSTGGGNIHIPYKKAGGADNRDDGSLVIYGSSASDGIQSLFSKSTDGGATFTGLISSGTWEPSHSYIGSSINAFTHDANYLWLGFEQASSFTNAFFRTTTEISFIHSLDSGQGREGMINGWSMNPNAAIAWALTTGSGTIRMTIDDGTTWFGDKPASWAFGIAYAEFDLSDFITARG